MFTPFFKLKALLGSASLLLSVSVYAEDNHFESKIEMSYEHESSITACNEAFDLAEQDAIDQMDAYFTDIDTPLPYSISLSEQQETTTQTDDGLFLCEFIGTWQGNEVLGSETLIGEEVSIEGSFSANCLDDKNGDICWQRIVRAAQKELFINLDQSYSDADKIHLIYVDFEGRQRDAFTKGRLEMTADGTFYFDVVERLSSTKSNTTQIRITRSDDLENESFENEELDNDDDEYDFQSRSTDNSRADDNDDSNIDITVFYVWDGNDTAETDSLAISSERYGVGLWANNRIGFSVFSGTDTFGIGNSKDDVKNDKGQYETLGVGVGFRLWQNRSLTIENMLYIVDAQPYSDLVDPSNCAGCTARSVDARDYVQSTINIKTNSHGVNVGWMFTWKYLENTPNLDKLSSGFYLELQL